MAEVAPVLVDVSLKARGGAVTVAQVGEAVVQGKFGYLKDDGKYWKSDNSTATLANTSVMFLTPAPSDGYAVVAGNGSHVDLGATLTTTEMYAISSTSGNIEPIGDVASSEFVTFVGHATDASTLVLKFNATGIAKP